ncbi:MAG: hypothetical protein Q8O25_15295 [Sulfurisoma sp.]|nr:hypothetical protein [Sulfurisoma sp.]
MPLRLEPFFVGYLVFWIAASIAAAAMLAMRPRHFSLLTAGYRRFLAQPWKLGTFAVAATGMTVIAPWTGDPTWDYFDAFLMSALTFATAPWATGIFYRTAKGRETAAAIYVALCLMLFSASWCYDLYLLLRDGVYPLTWWANLKASSILYLLAGMLWNLEWRPGHGVSFAFMEPDWPHGASAALSWRLFWVMLPFMLLTTALILPFLWGGWG